MQLPIKEELRRYGAHLSTTCGNSMEPLLRTGRDVVTVLPKKDRLKKYDIALYQYPSGHYVLHRVIGLEQNGYLICGDNRLVMEHIPEDWVIGYAASIRRDGRPDCMNSLKYKAYVRIRCALYPMRVLTDKVRRKLHSFIKKK